MTYLHTYRQLRTNIQIYKKGVKYVIRVVRFNEDGSLRHKDIYEVYTPFSVRHVIRHIIDDAVIQGIRLSEIEIYNKTAVKLKDPLVKVQYI